MRPAVLWIWLFLLMVSGTFAACSKSDRKPAGPPEKVTLAIATLPDTTLAQVAQSLGYFRDEGLEPTVHLHQYGKRALKEVLDGQADFATVAETPVMYAVMDGAKVSVVATILTSYLNHAVVARRDRGIASLADLKGKRIATTHGTTSDFFLHTFLVTHGIGEKDVQILDVPAEKVAAAIVSGEVDAVSAFSPFTVLAQHGLGANAVTFRDKDIYRYSFNVVASQNLIRTRPATVEKVLRALVRAEGFTRSNPGGAQKIVASFTGQPLDLVADFWRDATFAVTLDQTLVLSLEDESEWAIKKGRTTAKVVPNYLDFIYLDGLKSVKPTAVRILK